MATFSAEVDVRPASFAAIDSNGRVDSTKSLTVDFNPASLQLQLSNTLEQGGSTTQHVKTSSAKLSMDLVFDTTDTLMDVRLRTQKLVDLLTPQQHGSQRVAQTVLFQWGTFSFKGLIETYKETLDFFSADGVPLRAGVNVTLSHQDLVFGDTDASRGAARPPGGAVRGEAEPVETAPTPPGSGVTSVTQQGDTNGTQDTGRDVAARNGVESMRFPEGPLVVDPGVALGPPAAFAAGGAGVAAGAGAAAGASAAFGASATGAFGASATAGFGAGGGATFGAGASAVFGASASARFGASAGAGAGAFAGVGAFGGAAFAGAGAGGFARAGVGAFASAGASAFAGAGAGAFAGSGGGARAGVGAGAFVGASAGAFAGAGAGVAVYGGGGYSAGVGGVVVAPGEAPRFGGWASAGVPASLGAFAGLRAPSARPRAILDPSLLLPRRPTGPLATHARASFDLTGRAQVAGSAGFSLRGRVSFYEGV